MSNYNAEDIIERFGGLRPMSAKTNIPVTTIQGWKKRNSIPENRMDDIIAAAKEHGVDLSGLNTTSSAKTAKSVDSDAPKSSNAIANKVENKSVNNAPYAGAAQDQKTPEIKDNSYKADKNIASQTPPKTDESVVYLNKEAAPDTAYINTRLAAAEKNAIRTSAVISTLIFVIGVGAIAILLWPKAKDVESRVEGNSRDVAQIYNDLRDMKNGGSFLDGILPKDWNEQITSMTRQATELKDQAAQIQTQVGEALKQAETISTDILGENAGSLDQRISKIETHLGTFAGNPHMSAFLNRIRNLDASTNGQNMLDSSLKELSALLSNYNGTPEQLDGYLNNARTQSQNLTQTFENVPGEDMKAAAMLLAFNQFRSTMNRDGQPFGDDLQLLKNFIGSDSTELHAAIDRLAPHAQSGVLTLSGLSSELRSIAGDAVVSSIKGEDVALEEKAKARLNDLFSVERNGELITGTSVQAKLTNAQKYLDAGELDKAIAEARSIDGKASETLAPWISEAEKTRDAQNVSSILEYNIDLRTHGLMQNVMQVKENGKLGNMAQPGTFPAAGRMIEDPKSGLKIYIPAENKVLEKPISAKTVPAIPANTETGTTSNGLIAPKGLMTE